MQSIIDHFQQYLPLTEAEQELILTRVKQRSIKRRQMILQEGFVRRHYTFIVKGCFKMYGVDDRGTEHNIQFAAEDDWIADIGSFHSKKTQQTFY